MDYPDVLGLVPPGPRPGATPDNLWIIRTFWGLSRLTHGPSVPGLLVPVPENISIIRMTGDTGPRARLRDLALFTIDPFYRPLYFYITYVRCAHFRTRIFPPRLY